MPLALWRPFENLAQSLKRSSKETKDSQQISNTNKQ